MTILKSWSRVAILAAVTVFANLAPAAAAHQVFSGKVVHVSTNNIKVLDLKHHKAMSFLVVPHFDKVLSFDGKATYQMKSIHPGMFVRVEYDQHALGARHADRIIMLDSYGRSVKKMGS